MNQKFENLLYTSGLTSQGCWDSFDQYDQDAIKRFAELIVEECARLLINEAECNYDEDSMTYMTLIEEANWFRIYFGIE